MSGLDELERRRKWGNRRRVFLTVVAALTVLGGGGYGLAFLGIVDVPGITPADRLSNAFQAPVQLDGPQPTTAIMTHSLLVNVYRTDETPLGVVLALRDRLPAMLFFYAPLEVEERIQYALFAGPGYNAVQTDSLKGILAPVLDRQNPDEWVVRETSYAFFFGEYEGASEAQDRVDGLLGREIPSYTLQVDYPDGSSGYRVYGGAYGDEFQAVTMGELLRDQGITEIILTERRGKRPE